MKINQLYTNGIKDTFFYFISTAGSKLITLLVIPILTKLISPDDFAAYDIFLLSTAFLALIVSLGTDSGIAIFLVDEKEDLDKIGTLISFCLLLNLIMILSIFTVALIANNFYSLNKFFGVSIFLFFANLLLTSIVNFSASLFRWMGNAKLSSIISFLGATIGFTIGFILLKNFHTISSFINGIIIGNLITLILVFLLLKKYLRKIDFAMNREIYLNLLKTSIPFLPSYLVYYLALYIDRFLVLQLLGSTALGYYALASRISQIPNFGLSILTKGFQPVILSNYKTNEGINMARNLYTYFILSLPFILLLMIVFSNPIVIFFGGDSFRGSTSIVPMITISTLIIGGMSLNGFGFIIQKENIWMFYTSVFLLVLNFIFALVLSNFFAINGIAFATLISSCIAAVFYTYNSEKLYSFNLSIIWTVIIYCILVIICFLYISKII